MSAQIGISKKCAGSMLNCYLLYRGTWEVAATKVIFLLDSRKLEVAIKL